VWVLCDDSKYLLGFGVYDTSYVPALLTTRGSEYAGSFVIPVEVVVDVASMGEASKSSSSSSNTINSRALVPS